MFELWRKNSLKMEIERLKKELDATANFADIVKDELRNTKEQLADVKLKKKIEEEDIKHMVRMKEERSVVDLERKSLEMERAKDAAIAEVKDEYRDKMEGFLKTQVSDTKEMYSDILARLPDVNVQLNKELK